MGLYPIIAIMLFTILIIGLASYSFYRLMAKPTLNARLVEHVYYYPALNEIGIYHMTPKEISGDSTVYLGVL